MPRTRRAEKPTLAAAEATPENIPAVMPATGAASGTAVREHRQPAEEMADAKPAYAADPHEKISVSLSAVKGGPEMHLLRSHRFNQLQIRFDREQPDEQYLKMLRDAGWRDRTEEEGVYTKQIDPEARWQSVDRMEKEFKSMANAIRKDKKLPAGPGTRIVRRIDTDSRPANGLRHVDSLPAAVWWPEPSRCPVRASYRVLAACPDFLLPPPGAGPALRRSAASGVAGGTGLFHYPACHRRPRRCRWRSVTGP